MYVILAEKPSQAASIAAALKEITLSNGEILETKHLSIPKYERLIKHARKDGYFQGKNFYITYAFGHLFTLKEPHEVNANLKSWKLDLLPFHIEDIPLKLSGGSTFANNKKQFDTIKKLFNDTSVKGIIFSTDAGREGEHIARTVYKMARSKKPFERMWLRDMTEEGILKAFKERKPGSHYDGLAEAAVCRAESDYLVGMNMTRAMTIKFGGFKNVLSVGRVQTPTLAILVNRELEIQNFVPEDFLTLKATFNHTNGEYEALWFNGKEDRFTDKKKGDDVFKKIKGKAGVLTQVDVKEDRERNPLLFDLTELQRTMNRIKGFSASKTLEVAQKLYDEKKLITYPRTSSRYLATGTGKTVKSVLKNLQSAFGPIVDEALNKNYSFARYMINDSKTTDHEAIIPTAKSPNLSSLSADEKAVYEVIVKRFVAAFYPVCVWEQTSTVTTVEGETFKASGKSLKDAGWRKVEGIPNANILPLMKKGDAVENKDSKLEKKKTQPPKRLSDADLLSAMENAGKFVEEDELKEMLKESGIGTPATRSSIIEELIKRGYVVRDKKALVPTPEKGMALMETLPVELLKSPEMTGLWEKKLSEVESGKISRKQFMVEMKQAVETMVGDVKGSTGQKLSSAPQTATKRTTASKGTKASTSTAGTKKEVGTCPTCKKGTIVEHDKAFSCSEYKSGCKFTIWKNAMENFGKKNITLTEAKQLVKNGKTTKKVKLHSKAKNKDFEAFLVYENGRIQMKF